MVVTALASEFGITEPIIQARANRKVSEETKTNIQNFYLRTDISYTMPGMKDLMTVWNDDGNKEKLTKHYMNMFLREAFALYREEFGNTEFDIQRSTFCSLRPRNVLLLNDTPKDQCKCKTHENFFLMLEAMGISYCKNIWDTLLCYTNGNSSCWLGVCDKCKNGCKLQPRCM